MALSGKRAAGCTRADGPCTDSAAACRKAAEQQKRTKKNVPIGGKCDSVEIAYSAVYVQYILGLEDGFGS